LLQRGLFGEKPPVIFGKAPFVFGLLIKAAKWGADAPGFYRRENVELLDAGYT